VIPIYLKRGEDRRLRLGHPWVYSNQIDIHKSPLKGIPPGEPVELWNYRNVFVASAYVNPHSLIACRLLGRSRAMVLDAELIEARIRRADEFRRHNLHGPHYRAVFGESDDLPGLIIDRYDDVCVVQITAAGMERARSEVIAAVRAVFNPRSIVLRDDNSSRKLEGLDEGIEVLGDDLTEGVEIVEGHARFRIDVIAGQKTGWFFDHRANRQALRGWVRGARVLDAFSYVGAWGIQCAMAGAKEVVCIDSSASALERLGENARLNGVHNEVAVERADVFEALRELRNRGEKFDVVILDPPAFIRRRKDLASGAEAYRRINGWGLQLLEPGGLMVSASCSSHLTRERHRELLGRVLWGLKASARIVLDGRQDIDHPVHPGLPESEYLKASFVQLLERAAD
jgi:23S rRNA (cytosine1962-C5)-methyltransferase